MPAETSFKGSFKDSGGDTLLGLEKKANAMRPVETGGLFSGTEYKADDEPSGPEILKGRASYSESRKDTAKLGAALFKSSMEAVGPGGLTS